MDRARYPLRETGGRRAVRGLVGERNDTVQSEMGCH